MEDPEVTLSQTEDDEEAHTSDSSSQDQTDFGEEDVTLTSAARFIEVLTHRNNESEKISALDSFSAILESAETDYLCQKVPDYLNERDNYKIGTLLNMVIHNDDMINFLATQAETCVLSPP